LLALVVGEEGKGERNGRVLSREDAESCDATIESALPVPASLALGWVIDWREKSVSWKRR